MADFSPSLSDAHWAANGDCHYCGVHTLMPYECLPQDSRLATRDHKVPRILGGGDGDNIVLACQRCNNAKGDMAYEEFVELVTRLKAKGKLGRIVSYGKRYARRTALRMATEVRDE